MDTIGIEARSQLMAKIRSTGSLSTEGRLATALRKAGVKGWRRNLKLRFGIANTSLTDLAKGSSKKVFVVRPDFVFMKSRLAVFTDGCFWHSCPKHGRIPKQRRRFWSSKLKSNILRDRRVERVLKASGWLSLRIWEHTLKQTPDACVRRIERALAIRKK